MTKIFYTDEVETHALAGIHLEIKKGEYVAVAGPSGCGKSTLMSILGLLDSPTQGSYTLNGRPVADLTLSERARVRNREIGFILMRYTGEEKKEERQAAAKHVKGLWGKVKGTFSSDDEAEDIVK